MGAALFVCRGCGRESANPVADLANMRARGHLGCCPEREIVQVRPCLFPQPELIRIEAVNMTTGGFYGVADWRRLRSEFESESYLLGVCGLDAPWALPRGSVSARVAFGSAVIEHFLVSRMGSLV